MSNCQGSGDSPVPSTAIMYLHRLRSSSYTPRGLATHQPRRRLNRVVTTLRVVLVTAPMFGETAAAEIVAAGARGMSAMSSSDSVGSQRVNAEPE